MIKRSLLSVLCVAGAALAVSPAFAYDGTITFTGAISDNTCTIAGGGAASADFSVNLPKVAASTLSSAGQVAGMTPFSIRLTNCKNNGKVSTFFEMGSSVDPNTGDLKNQSGGAGGAKNVQVRLANANDGSRINIAQGTQQGSSQVDITDSTATLNYFAQYVATAAAEAGNVSTTVTYTMNYE
jgi:major type 1 subunit fimbrin (pilin)